ncbi:hypothetical protein HDV01_001148 [Terramyces sp. JEL0728]|nr:hypothetical protein HDV01_001148 [Terramyces sp. JEL0728]
MVSLHLYLKDLGYGATYSSNVILAVLEQLGIYPSNAHMKINDKDVANVLMMMIQTCSGLPDNPTLHSLTSGILDEASEQMLSQMKTWNVDLFFPLSTKLDWNKVLRYLDNPEANFKTLDNVSVLLKACKAVVPELNNFPTNIFLDRWENRKAQLSFLTHVVKVTPELFTLSKHVTRHVVSKETFPLNATTRFFFNSCIQSCWNSLDLCRIVLDYSDLKECHALIDLAFEQAPEILLLAILSFNLPRSGFVEDLSRKLVIALISGNANAPIVLPKVWDTYPAVIIEGMVALYSTDGSSLSRILDVAQELKALSQILETKRYAFAIDLAALSSRREYLNLEKWLQDHIREGGELFVRACLEFLNDKITAAQHGRSDIPQTVLLSPDVVTTFLKVLHANSSQMSPENQDYREKIFNACAQLFPRGDAQEVEVAIFPPDIEEETNAFYEKIYKGELSIPQVIELLQILKKSPNIRDQETFKCMIHNLFDEYKFFSRYPDRELIITSILFGVLIQNQIVTSVSLGIALRYVLEALRQPVGSKLFQFGISALAQFQGRLPEWSQYCSLLLQIEHLHQAHPKIIHFIKNVQRQTTPGNPNAAVDNGFQRPIQQDGIFSALQLYGIINESEVGHFEVPSEAVRDNILFVVNNVTLTNIPSKVADLLEILKFSHLRWFCNYIVVKRVSVEPNNQAIYLDFMDNLKIPQIYPIVLHETLSSIRGLLNSEKTLNSSQERSFLKNLGAWLGTISLARNKPIKHNNLAFKELLMEGYELKRLIVVIPFVCKVLEQCSGSKVFRPPNPWLMAIMRLLAELYHFAELKLNLKFEIEVLCKNLKLDIKGTQTTHLDIKPTEILRKRIQSGSRRESENEAYRQPGFDASVNRSVQEDDGIGIGYPNLASFITFNPNITLFNSQPTLKRIVHIAIDKSIQEVIRSPVVERSVTIAIIATREIVTKDFALEPNEEKMRKSAQYMVQSLAGSLASVSSREPLKISMISNLKTLLMANGYTEQTVPEQIIFIIVSDNLDLACSVMEKAAAEKSIPEIDETLALSFVNRRKHREQRSGQQFFDPSAFNSTRFLNGLPEGLQPRPGGLSPNQLSVYEAFMRIPFINSNPGNTDFIEEAERLRPQLPRQEIRGEGLASVPIQYEILPPEQILQKFTIIMTELDLHITENASSTFDLLPNQHPIKTALGQISYILSQSANADECCLLCGEKVVQMLFANKSSLACEVYVFILRKLIDGAKVLSRELKEWFLYGDDQRKYDTRITIALINAQILTCSDIDNRLGQMIDAGSSGSIFFAISLIREILVSNNVVGTTDFLYTINAIKSIDGRGANVDRIKGFLQDISSYTSLGRLKRSISTDAAFKSLLAMVFEEWVHVYSHPSSSVKARAEYIEEFFSISFMKADNSMATFLRTCIEICVSLFNQQPASPENAYLSIDAFACFVIMAILKISENSERKPFLTKTLGIICLETVNAHENIESIFNQKPFFRIFNSLIDQAKEFAAELGEIYAPLLSHICNTLYSLKPSMLPGFLFSWIQLISHRDLMGPLLSYDNQKYWPYYQKVMIALLTFLAPVLQSGQLNDTSKSLYRATLRVLLVLLHDYPEFLSGYHFSFIDVLPYTCVQLKNLILSAYPRDMRLPDPFTPNLKVDLLPEMNQNPQILSDYTQCLIDSNIKQELDTYLETRTPVSFLGRISSVLLNNSPSLPKYNISLINSLVFYVGVEAINQAQAKNIQGPPPVSNNVAMDIFQQLLVDLDSDGRYLFLSAISSHLRYPNSQTHYFSCVLLYLFSEANQEIMKEQITR